MTDIRDLTDDLSRLQCYTCRRVKTPKGWMKEYIPEREREYVSFDYCPMCDDAHSKIMQNYDKKKLKSRVALHRLAI